MYKINCKKKNSLLIITLLGANILVMLANSIISHYPKSEKTIIYSTDISVNGDFDDYYDLIAINTLHNIKLNIIIDGVDKKEKLSGAKGIDLYDEKIGGGRVNIISEEI